MEIVITLVPWDIILKFIVAIICATAIGLERNYKNKPAGVRTCNLICIGTVLFIVLGQTIVGPGDPSRVMATIIQGIGFLGAGGIIANNGNVSGLTTAAVVWTLAAVGSAIGFGFFKLAFTVTILIGVVLFCAGKLEDKVKDWMHD